MGEARQFSSHENIPAREEVKIEQEKTIHWLPDYRGIVSDKFANANSEIDFYNVALCPDNVRTFILGANKDQLLSRFKECLEQFKTPQKFADVLPVEFVAEHLSRFPSKSIDARLVANKLMGTQQSVLLVNNAVGFLKMGLEPAFLADCILKIRGPRQLLIHISEFPKGSVDMRLLATRLKDEGNVALVADKMELFSEADIDKRELAELLMRDGKHSVILKHINEFPEGAVDIARLVDWCFENIPVVLAKYFDKLPDGSVDELKLVDELIRKRLLTDLQWHIDKILIKSGLSKEIADRLWEANEKLFLARNFRLFPKGAVDKTRLADWLIESGLVNTVLVYFDDFEIGIECAQKIMKAVQKNSDGLGAIGEHADALIKAGIPPEDIVREFLSRELYPALLSNLDKFPKDSVDADELVRALFKINFQFKNIRTVLTLLERVSDKNLLIERLIEGSPEIIVKHLEEFPKGSVDIVFLLDRLLEKHPDGVVLIHHLEKFPRGSVDIQVLVDALIKHGKKYKLSSNFEKLFFFGADARYIVKKLFDAGLEGLVRDNYERFPPDAFTEEMKERLMSFSINNALSQRRYALVRLWLEKAPESEKLGIRNFFDMDAVMLEWEALIKDGRLENARQLVACMELTGIPAPENKHSPAGQDQIIPREIENKADALRTIDRIMDFYVDSYLDMKMLYLEGVTDWKYKLDFKDLRDLKDLQEAISAGQRALTSWLKLSMLDAVAGEMNNHQPTDWLQIPAIDARSVFMFASREFILDYLESAAWKFQDSGWAEGYGGSSWSRIAKAGYALWASDESVAPIINDYIFDLQHNTGTVLNKQDSELIQRPELLMQLLDLKREKDIYQVLKNLDDVCSQKALSGAFARLRVMDRITKKVLG